MSVQVCIDWRLSTLVICTVQVKDVSVGVVRPLTKDARVEASVRLENINRRDEEKRRTAEAKNNLESYIYMAKEKVRSYVDMAMWEFLLTYNLRSVPLLFWIAKYVLFICDHLKCIK